MFYELDDIFGWFYLIYLNPLIWKCVIPSIWSSCNSLAWRSLLFFRSRTYCILAVTSIILYWNWIFCRTWILVRHSYRFGHHFPIFQGTVSHKLRVKFKVNGPKRLEHGPSIINQCITVEPIHDCPGWLKDFQVDLWTYDEIEKAKSTNGNCIRHDWSTLNVDIISNSLWICLFQFWSLWWYPYYCCRSASCCSRWNFIPTHHFEIRWSPDTRTNDYQTQKGFWPTHQVRIFHFDN